MQIHKPVFIIGSFRGGTSLLFRLLSESDELWSLYRESNHMWQPWHRDPRETADTVVLKAEDVKEGDREHFDKHYHFSAYDNHLMGELSRIRFLRNRLSLLFNLINLCNYLYKCLKLCIFKRQSNDKKSIAYRIIDKTPPNCFRVEYLAKLYPDAKFIYITRDGLDNTSSLMNAWRSKQKFQFRYRKYLEEYLEPLDDNVRKYFDIDGYQSDVWKFAMPPDWEAYRDKTLAEVCAFQWLKTHEYALNSLSKLAPERVIRFKFEDLMAEPHTSIEKLCSFLEIEFTWNMQKIVSEMPLVNTFTPASKRKSRKNQADLETIKDYIEPMQQQLGYVTIL
ncbi:MAG: sulfotransferase [Candidatus Melainabacteria bacterium]|nr:sulfotransferase [Candidatus Melainabacteria bacterium]